MEVQNQKMKEVLVEIQSGQFASEWVSNYKKDKKSAFETMLLELENHEIEKVGKDLRKMMWPNENVN
jgi:ketol-acid reductoisomerase